MNDLTPTLFIVGGLIIAVLVGVALYYHFLLYRKTKQREAQQVELEKILQDRRERNSESVVILARALLDDQVTMTEASIRINALAQSLKLREEVQQELLVFRQLSEATQHIPILEKWRALSRHEKKAFDKERENIEAKFRDFVLDTSKKIVHQGLLDA